VTSFLDLSLHDATLLGVSFSWAKREAVAEILLSEAASVGRPPLRARWFGCSRIVIPHEQPWGQSASINAHGFEGRRFWIEMQSGDLVEFWADGFEVV